MRLKQVIERVIGDKFDGNDRASTGAPTRVSPLAQTCLASHESFLRGKRAEQSNLPTTSLRACLHHCFRRDIEDPPPVYMDSLLENVDSMQLREVGKPIVQLWEMRWLQRGELRADVGL